MLESVRLAAIPAMAEALRRYERWRRFNSFALAAATDGLNRLFSNDIAPLRAIRDLGLGIVDAIGPACGASSCAMPAAISANCRG